MKLYNKSELRYSRIFFDKKPPAFVFILISSTAIILSGALIGAAYIPKNYIVKEWEFTYNRYRVPISN